MGQGRQENVAVIPQRGDVDDYQRLENRWDVNRESLAVMGQGRQENVAVLLQRGDVDDY